MPEPVVWYLVDNYLHDNEYDFLNDEDFNALRLSYLSKAEDDNSSEKKRKNFFKINFEFLVKFMNSWTWQIIIFSANTGMILSLYYFLDM